MDYEKFIDDKISDIKKTVGKATAINALSGGVDSSTVTVLGHRAIGEQLKTIFVDNALMREGEPEHVVKIFADMGISIELIDAREEFLSALKGLTDPEQKRQAITDTFYSNVFTLNPLLNTKKTVFSKNLTKTEGLNRLTNSSGIEQKS